MHIIMNIIRITAATAATGLLVGLAGTSASAAPSPEDTYIIVSTNTTSVSAQSVESAVESAGGEDVVTYDNVGASVATLTASEAAALDAKPNFVVAKDGPTHATAEKGPITAADSKATLAPLGDSKAAAAAQSWGLDRVDQRPTALNGQYNLPAGVNGTGVDVYVFDTGINLDHPEFAGRTTGDHWDFVGDGNGAYDANGHGTHVAGTIGSSIFGVAPKARLHSVRVLDANGEGYWSDFIEGLNAVVRVAPPASVINASMGGDYNAAVDQVVDITVLSYNIPVVVAAGNMADDARYYSPASTQTATTVTASENGDWDAYYANYGSAVDLYAPGTDIWSTYYADPTQMMQLSGTSMAAPHVTGWMALYFDAYPNASWAQADSTLKSHATPNAIKDDYYGSPNKLVYTAGLAQVPNGPAASLGTVTHNSIGMKWATPTSPKGAITAYAFTYTGGGVTKTFTYTPATAKNPFTFTGLKPNTAYKVSVKAKNANGWGPATTLSVTTKKPPVPYKVYTNSAKSKFYIDLPDKGSGYWSFTIQKWDGTKWVSKSTYKTYYSTEKRTLDLTKGKYRAVVAEKYGYAKTYTSSVTLLK